MLTFLLKLIKCGVRAQFISRCGPMWSKKRQLKKEEKESENFEEANKPEGKVKTNKKKKKKQFKI